MENTRTRHTNLFKKMKKAHEALFMSQTGKVLCKVCGNYYHPKKFEMCWECFSKQPKRVKQYEETKNR